MKTINTNKAPQAIGPYCQAIQVDNGTIYLSGQLGLNPSTMQLGNSVIKQTDQALKNVEFILKEAGYEKKDVVKTLVLLSEISYFDEMNEAYNEFFKGHKPARSAFQVAALPLGALVEIEIIAYKKP